MGQINELVAEVGAINTANGWREDDGTSLACDHPKAMIAGMTAFSADVAETIETIRDGGRDPGAVYCNVHSRCRLTWDLASDVLDDLSEHGLPAYGSKTEAIARLRLVDTETMEASEAVHKGDVENLAEELADIVIRVMDFVGAWNETHQDDPIDLEAAILNKLARNRTRGYRHGGKRA